MRGLGARALGSSQVSDWGARGPLYIPSVQAPTRHPTHGDDFVRGVNTSRWTRRTVASGDETLGPDWLTVQLGATASAGYYQAIPSGDFIATCRYAVSAAGAHMIGVAAVSSSTGNGVAHCPYNDGSAYMGAVSGWAYASFSAYTAYPMGAYHGGAPLYSQLRRVTGTNTWSVRWGIDATRPMSPHAGASVEDGVHWSAWSSRADAVSVDSIGLLRTLGAISMQVSIDYFDVKSI